MGKGTLLQASSYLMASYRAPFVQWLTLFVVLDDGNNVSENIQVSLSCCLFVVGVVLLVGLLTPSGGDTHTKRHMK